MGKEEKIIKKIAEELFEKLEIDGDVSVDLSDEMINIVLETEDSGIVIGRHGDVLESLQTILALCISNKLDKFHRLNAC